MNKLIKLILTGAACIGLAITSHAQGLQTQLAASGTNNLGLANTTNTYALFGDSSGVYTNGIVTGAATGANSFISCVTSSKVTLFTGGLFSNPTTTNITYTITVAGSADLAHWTNTVTTFTITSLASTTNQYNQLQLLSGYQAGPLPFYAIRSITASPLFSTAGVGATNVYFGGYAY